MTAAATDTGKIYDRMLKCLELTASDNDAEALLAIRKANQLRAKLGLRWALPLQAPPGAQKPEPEPEPEVDEYDYDAVFAVIWRYGSQSEKWTGVLRNIEEYWHTVGKLSPKQHNLVMKFYETAAEARS